MKLLISVIVPVYNVEKYLPRCIESIINQTYKNLEIILVDDGSPDNCGRICEQYAKLDSRIIVIHKENQGLSRARRTGIESSTGEYIGFVDSDDWIADDMYEYMIDKMTQNKVEIVECAYQLIFDEYESIATCVEGGLLKNTVENPRCTYENMFLYDPNRKNHISPSLCNKLFKKEILDKCYKNVPRIDYCEDSALTYACNVITQAMYISKRVLYFYNRQNPSSMMFDKKREEKKMTDIVKMYLFLKECFRMHRDADYLIEQVNQYYVKLVIENTNGKLSSYLFPDELERDIKIIIYGAGKVGESYCRQIRNDNKVQLVGVVDKNPRESSIQDVIVDEVSSITKRAFDIIVIAILDEAVARQVKEVLVNEYKIDSKKIIWEKPIRFVGLVMG